MALTRLGETATEHARDVIASVGRLTSAAVAELGLERGKLVIGLSPIATTGLGRRIAEFAEAHPGLRIDIEAGIDRDFVAALYRGQIDLAISSAGYSAEIPICWIKRSILHLLPPVVDARNQS